MAGDMNPASDAAATPTPSADAPKAEKPAKPEKKAPDQIVLRGYSKMIYFWPIAMISLVFYLITAGWAFNVENTQPYTVWWLLVFVINLLIFTMDFGRNNFITVFSLMGLVVAGLTAWDVSSGGIWSGIYEFFHSMNVNVGANFFLVMFVIFGFYLALARIFAQFDYFIIRSNELIHKHGILGDEKSYKSLNMHIEKDIPDVFEYLIGFGAGRMVFRPQISGGREEILVVENVLFMNRTERKIRDYLSKIDVT